MKSNGIQNFNMDNDFIIAYTVGDQPVKAASYKLHIPVLMPLITPADKIVNNPYIHNVYINDETPSFDVSFQSQNYMTVNTLKSNQNLKDNGLETLPNGTKVLCIVLNNNINNIYLFSLL